MTAHEVVAEVVGSKVWHMQTMIVVLKIVGWSVGAVALVLERRKHKVQHRAGIWNVGIHRVAMALGLGYAWDWRSVSPGSEAAKY